MGCDIHAFLEIKLGKEWHNYGNIPIGRNYQLFSKMTDIVGRGDQEAIAKQRGLPIDCSKIVKFLLEEEGTHTLSWLSKKELKELAEWHLEYYEHQPLPFDDHELFDKCRLVFGFDN